MKLVNPSLRPDEGETEPGLEGGKGHAGRAT
jgi:hypothetical protein